MALHYNLSAIKDNETVCWTGPDDDARMNPVTEGLIFMTISVGIPKITEENWREFAVRYLMVHGALQFDGDLYSPQDIQAHVGLSTNASAMSKAKFNGSITRVLRERIERKI